MTFLGSKTNSTALKTVSSLAENYDGMMLGFGLKNSVLFAKPKVLKRLLAGLENRILTERETET